MLLSLVLAASVACQGDVESRLAEIRSLQEAGEFEASIEPLRGLVTTNSSHPEVNFRLGLALVRTGRQSLSIWPLQKALDSEAHGLAAGILLINALLNTQDYEEAVRVADRVLATNPDNEMALWGRANANISGAMPEAALDDADRLRALNPSDPRAMILRSAALADLDRLDEAEAVQLEVEEIASEAGDQNQAARACVARGVLLARTDRPSRASETFRTCVERYPADAVVRKQATDHFVDQREFASAVEMWRAAVDEEPEDGALRVRLAELLRLDERTDEAEAVLAEMVELFDSASAWRAMATFRRNSGEIASAREALEQAIERTPGDTSPLRYELADLYIESGDLDGARQIAGELDEPAYSQLLRGAIALKENDPKGALEYFESGLRRWPNNASARYLTGVAAEQLDDQPRAMAEYREAIRNDPGRTDAALRLAEIHYARAEYRAALDFARTHINKRPFSGAAGHVLVARSATAQADHESAASALQQLMSQPGHEATALAELASAAGQAHGAEQAVEAIELAGAEHPEAVASAEVQRVLVGLLSEAGRTEDALARARVNLASAPDDALAHDLVGRVLLQLSRIDDAATEFEQAAALAPEAAAPQEGLGLVAMSRGDYAGALSHFDAAAKLDPSIGEYLYRGAQVLLATGDRDGAMARLRETVETEPAHAGACNDLAWLLVDTGGDLERALELARRAVRVSTNGATLDTLGWVRLKRGDADQAEQTFVRAINAAGESPSLQYHLGLALAQQGKTSEAIEVLRKAVAADAFPESDAAVAELARLEQP
ncbi:MAG: tetratricopeptide repeat protein [Myxococcota bacterium]|nr:tetratricopeptide repeat protein [Myxococcota bacterium]